MIDTSPIAVNRTLRRKPNADYRPREYLTEAEIERLIEAARKRGRNGLRDSAAILLAYRHGLRAQELCSLRWSQIDLRHGRLHVNRAKGGIESVHPLHGPELRALRPLQGSSPYVFVTEAGTPVTTAWFLRMIQRTGRAAKLPFPILTCSAIQPDTSSRTTGRTPGAWRIISGIETCRAQRNTLR
jgi:type 1 fimbriae regulatory protein FimB/type 1 fimbriae regulatory protein FimE